jgi:type 2A phosphatase activator TIP41
MPDAITAALRDSNQVVNLLPVVESCVDSVCLAPKS